MVFRLLRKTHHAHVLVCRTCGEAYGAATTRIKEAIEKELLAVPGQSWNVRVVESSCLDVCPVGAVSVRLVGAEECDARSLTWSVGPQDDTHAFTSELKKYLTPASRN